MAKMNPWVKRKWVKALRSGEYRQGTGFLVVEDPLTRWYEHCCLGVLACEMAPEFVRKGDDGLGVGNDTAMLPDDLAIMYGLDMPVQEALADKNDAGDDFLDIADWIDKNL